MEGKKKASTPWCLSPFGTDAEKAKAESLFASFLAYPRQVRVLAEALMVSSLELKDLDGKVIPYFLESSYALQMAQQLIAGIPAFPNIKVSVLD